MGLVMRDDGQGLDEQDYDIDADDYIRSLGDDISIY